MANGISGFLGNLARQAAGSQLTKDLLSTLPILALSYPLAELAASTTGSAGQPRARANVYRVLGSLAAGRLGQGGQERNQLLNLLAGQDLLALAPPTPGARPLATLAGQPLYQETRALRDIPGLLPAGTQKLVPALPPQGITLPPGETAFRREAVRTPVEAAMVSAYGGLPASSRNIAAAGQALLKQAQAAEEQRTYAESIKAITEGAPGGGRLGLRIGAGGRLSPYLLPERPPSVKQQALDAVAQGQGLPGFSLAETKKIAVGPERSSIIERYLSAGEIRDYYLTGRLKDIEQTRVLARLEAIDRDRRGVREKLLLLRPYVDEGGNLLPGIDPTALNQAMITSGVFDPQEIKGLVAAERSLDLEEQETLGRLKKAGAGTLPPSGAAVSPPVGGRPISEADIQGMAKKYGLTREQVIQDLKSKGVQFGR